MPDFINILAALGAPISAVIVTVIGAIFASRGLKTARTDEVEARNSLSTINMTEGSTVVINERHNNEGEAQTDETIALTTFAALWTANQKRIEAYHTIVTSQSRTSFISSQIVTFVGFAVIVGVAIIAIQSTTTAGAIAAGTVGVVGGALSAYISATFMKSQADASRLLRQFFFQPVEFARVLAAERLLEGMDPDVETRVRSEMIASVMSVMTLPDPTQDQRQSASK